MKTPLRIHWMIRLYRSVCHALVWWLQKSHPRWSDCHSVISYKMIELPSNQQLIILSSSHQMLILLSEIIILSSTRHMIMSYSLFHSVITWSDWYPRWSDGSPAVRWWYYHPVIRWSDYKNIIQLSDDQIAILSSKMIRLCSSVCHALLSGDFKNVIIQLLQAAGPQALPCTWSPIRPRAHNLCKIDTIVQHLHCPYLIFVTTADYVKI